MRPLPGVPDVVSPKRDIRSKGYPLLVLARGVKEADGVSILEEIVRLFCGGDEQISTKTQGLTQVQAARRLTHLLMHV